PRDMPRSIPPPLVRSENSPRVHELIRAGNLYLSLADALSLTIENNLDIELQRSLLPIADAELLRTRGGGVTRGLNLTLAQTTTVLTGSNTLVSSNTLFNAGIQQGFASGAVAALNFNNNRQALNSLRSGYSPYTGSGLGLTVTQPLLRGFGTSLNRRFIRIA